MNRKQVLFQSSWRNPNKALLLWNWEVGFEGWITGTTDSEKETGGRRASDQGGQILGFTWRPWRDSNTRHTG
jgi:hypothetical protein